MSTSLSEGFSDAVGADTFLGGRSEHRVQDDNERSETVATTSSFREPFISQRCLVPANGFYEWKWEGKTKQPYCFDVNDGELFAFAGLWDRWTNPQGEMVEVSQSSHDTLAAQPVQGPEQEQVELSLLCRQKHALKLRPCLPARAANGIHEFHRDRPALPVSKFAQLFQLITVVLLIGRYAGVNGDVHLWCVCSLCHRAAGAKLGGSGPGKLRLGHHPKSGGIA